MNYHDYHQISWLIPIFVVPRVHQGPPETSSSSPPWSALDLPALHARVSWAPLSWAAHPSRAWPAQPVASETLKRKTRCILGSYSQIHGRFRCHRIWKLSELSLFYNILHPNTSRKVWPLRMEFGINSTRSCRFWRPEKGWGHSWVLLLAVTTKNIKMPHGGLMKCGYPKKHPKLDHFWTCLVIFVLKPMMTWGSPIFRTLHRPMSWSLVIGFLTRFQPWSPGIPWQHCMGDATDFEGLQVALKHLRYVCVKLCQGRWAYTHRQTDRQTDKDTYIHTLHYMTWHGMAWHGMTWHYITLTYINLHITLH